MSTHKSARYVLPLLMFGFLVTVATARRVNLFRPATASEQTKFATTNPALASDPQQRRDLKALVFTARPTGFEPDEVEVSAGPVLIVVQNRSGRRDLSFQLQRESGERLHSERSQRLDWKHQIKLLSGTYVLREENHPEWRCVIRVIPL